MEKTKPHILKKDGQWIATLNGIYYYKYADSPCDAYKRLYNYFRFWWPGPIPIMPPRC